MGKKQTQETYGQVKNDQETAKTEEGQQKQQADNETRQAGGDINANRDTLEDGYTGLASGNVGSVGNVSAPQVNSKISTSRFDPIYSKYMGLADTGGFSDSSRSNIMGDVSGLRDLGKTGGLDANAMNRMRGNGVYDEFSQNGGLSLADRANIKSRALAPISSAFKGTSDELARRRSVQGGFAPGFDASSRALQRDTARNAASTALDANLDILDRVNAGRQWGAQGASNSENALQGLRTGNMYQGLTGASNTEMGLNNSIFGNQTSALGGARGTAGDIANIDAQNINNEFRNADSSLAASEFNAGTQGSNLDRSLNAQYTGLTGLNNIDQASMARYQNALDRGNAVVGQGNQINQGYYGARNPLAMQPGVGGNLMKLGSGALGAAAGMVGAPRINLGNFGSGNYLGLGSSDQFNYGVGGL